MMKYAPKNLLFLFLLNALLFGCNGNEAQNNAANASNTAQTSPKEAKIKANDNVEELEALIKIPFHPEEALWREENTAQNTKKLTAVLRFLPEESAKIVVEAETKKAASMTTLAVETWFPAELVAQSELSGDDTLKGNIYSAEQFYQSPYADGRLIRMENSNYFVLELFSK